MSMRDTMRKMAEDSQKFMPVPECTCISCGRKINRAALNLIWYYDEPGARPMQGGIAKPIAQGSRTIIQFPVCDECAPPCRKCNLPIKTKAVRDAAQKVSRQLGREVSGFPGCRHTHLPGSSLLARVKRLFGSAHGDDLPEVGDSRLGRVSSAIDEPFLNELTKTVENLLEQDRADIAAGKVPERRLIPHHAIKRDIALRAFQVDFDRLSPRMQELNQDDYESKTNEIRRMDQHQLDALLDAMRKQRTDLLELEDYVRSRNSLYKIVDAIFNRETDVQPGSEDGRSHASNFEIPMEEPSQGFKECWSAAGLHLQSQTRDAAINWLKADLNPPFLEHLSFRLGNQLFFIRIEDVEGRIQAPGSLDGLRSIADGCGGYACLIPMRLEGGKWKPQNPGWGLIDAQTGADVDPYALVTEDKVEMTDWELHDFAVQTVRDYVKDKLGRQIMSAQGNPEVNPSIWFVGEKGPEWVVVRAVRYPERDAHIPENIQTIEKECESLSSVGHFASVAVSSSEQEFTSSPGSRVDPLFRGHGMYVSFQGLKPIGATSSTSSKLASSSRPQPSLPAAAKENKTSDVGIAAVMEIKKLWQVDDQWSLNEERGFSWWGQDHRQRIWSDPGYDDDGIEVFRLHAETDFVCDIEKDEDAMFAALSLFNMHASTWAMVYDPGRSAIRLHSSMYVHEQTADWVPHTFAAAAIIQPVIAQIQAGFISGLVEGEPFISKHPSSGKRAEMDDMLNVIEHVYAPEGQKENSWKNSGEFEEVAKFFNGVDGFSMADPSGLTSEFAWGPNRTSMMNAVLNQPHPQLGNGVLIRLNLPLSFDRTKATRIAGHLNQMEAISMNRAHQLGAWCVGASETVVYVSFLPNIMYKPGVLTQLLLANGIRARWAAATLSPEAEAGEAIDIVKRRLEDLM